MIDIETHRALQVNTDGDAGPYLMVPMDQLTRVTGLLDGAGISFWVDEDAIELDGRAVIAIVNFGRGGDVSAVQAILDAVE